MSNSTHKAEVFRIEKMVKHPNADKLSIVTIFDAYKCVVRTEDFKVGDLAVYVPPDSVMPDKPEYAFLKGHLRIKAQRLRGAMSQGLILKAPPFTAVGDDVAESLGITHYVPGPNSRKGALSTGLTGPKPPKDYKKYDIDTYYRYASVIPDGVYVAIEEKIHGTSSKYTFQDGKMWAGSRNFWRKREMKNTEWYARLINKLTFGKFFKPGKETCTYWRALDENPWIEDFCRDNPGLILFGEIYGDIQDLKYGAKPGQIFFASFDIYDPATRKFFAAGLRYKIMDGYPDGKYAPVLATGPYSREFVESLISGKSMLADHLREGIVIKPLYAEFEDDTIGRAILKAVSPEYLERAK